LAIPNRSPYCTSKSGLIGFAKTLALSWASSISVQMRSRQEPSVGKGTWRLLSPRPAFSREVQKESHFAALDANQMGGTSSMSSETLASLVSPSAPRTLEGMEEAVTDAQQRPGFPLKVFARFRMVTKIAVSSSHCWSQRCEFFHADNPGFHEQFQPVGALIRCPRAPHPLPRRFPIYVAHPSRSILQSRAENRRILR